MQTLHFHSVYGAFSQLWKGNYELSLAGEAYAAECRFKIVDVDLGDSDPETCTGDEVYLLWGVFSVMGVTLPERLSAVRVRLVRDGVPLYEGTVNQSTSCEDFVATSEESGVCVFVEANDWGIERE